MMPSKGSTQEEQKPSEIEIHQLRRDVQLTLKKQQASMMHAMSDTMAELMRSKGPSESSSAGTSAAVGESPRQAGPNAVREMSAAAAGGEGDTAAG